MFSPETISLILIGLNIVLIESLLSIDNAAVLAAMVKDLPEEESKKALKYGIIGAFVLRGLSLVFVSILMKIIWLKIAGGIYLVYLSYDYFKKNWGVVSQGDEENEEPSAFAKWLRLSIGGLWGTVAMVEIMDLAFSVDNVFAAVAMTKNMYIIIGGVCVGIVAMRFVAQKFVSLMRSYPFLEKITFYVITLLGLKLIISGSFDYMGDSAFKTVLNSHLTDMLFSIAIVVIFAVPVIITRSRQQKTSSANVIPRSVLHG